MTLVDRVRELSTRPTERHPFGLRHAVLERACLLHYGGRLPWPEADAKAWTIEVDNGQTTIGGVA
jgi:hypothetical protein